MLPRRSAQKVNYCAQGCRCHVDVLPLHSVALAIRPLVLGYEYSSCLFHLETLSATWTWICRLVYDFCAHCVLVWGILCVNESVMENEGTSNHEAIATVLKESV